MFSLKVLTNWNKVGEGVKAQLTFLGFPVISSIGYSTDINQFIPKGDGLLVISPKGIVEGLPAWGLGAITLPDIAKTPGEHEYKFEASAIPGGPSVAEVKKKIYTITDSLILFILRNPVPGWPYWELAFWTGSSSVKYTPSISAVSLPMIFPPILTLAFAAAPKPIPIPEGYHGKTRTVYTPIGTPSIYSKEYDTPIITQWAMKPQVLWEIWYHTAPAFPEITPSKRSGQLKKEFDSIEWGKVYIIDGQELTVRELAPQETGIGLPIPEEITRPPLPHELITIPFKPEEEEEEIIRREKRRIEEEES